MTFSKDQLIAAAHSRIEFLEMMLAGELEPLKERALAIELQLASMALAGMETTHNSVIAEQLDHVLSGMDVTAHQRAVISCAVDRLNKNAELLQQAPRPLTTSERAELENWNAQQVVPGDITGPLEHAYKELTPHLMRNHISVFERYGIYPDGSAGIQAMRIALDGVERRAAMQSGAVKDGWVACSERMPPEATMVLGRCDNDYDFVNLLGGELKIFCMGEWRVLPGAQVTHWQPLPAAPQHDDKRELDEDALRGMANDPRAGVKAAEKVAESHHTGGKSE